MKTIKNEMLNLIKKVGSWLIWSSENPDNISLTIKGAIPALLFLASFLHWQLAESDLVAVANQLAVFISAGVALYGLVRKIGNSLDAKQQ